MSERHRRSHFAPESRLCGRADHAVPGAPKGVAARPVSVRPGAAPPRRAFECRDPYIYAHFGAPTQQQRGGRRWLVGGGTLDGRKWCERCAWRCAFKAVVHGAYVPLWVDQTMTC
jgi:hypothetical protein